MKPRISLITLGVDDLERSVTFYRDGLGLPTEGIVGKEFESGAVVFFELQGGRRRAQPGLRLPGTRSGVAMPAISRIPTDTCGRWRGIRSGIRKSDWPRLAMQAGVVRRFGFSRTLSG